MAGLAAVQKGRQRLDPGDAKPLRGFGRLMRNTDDTRVFKEALVAAAHGPFFPDWEFQTLFGLDRAEVERIAQTFSSATQLTGSVSLAVNNALTNLLWYPHGQEACWSQWLSLTPGELEAVFRRWRTSNSEA
jgi:hypothetical protein